MRALVLLVTVSLAGCSMKTEPATPPTPTQWVTDSVGMLSNDVRVKLNEELKAYQRRTKHHVLVWIGRTTGAEAVESYCLRAFNTWGIGREQENDGVVLFVFTDDDMRRIQVGYGLEAALTDRECVSIIRQRIRPLIRAGKHDDAILTGVAAILAEIDAWDAKR